MASVAKAGTDDARRTAAVSPRPKTRDNTKDTLCRNVTIYGHCRYENKGCAFVHDTSKRSGAGNSAKKQFNVDSPSFTPAAPNGSSGTGGLLNINGAAAKGIGLSPKTVGAAPFKPKSAGSMSSFSQGMGDFTTVSKKQYNPNAPDWSMAPTMSDGNEFLPQSHGMATNMATNMDPKENRLPKANPFIVSSDKGTVLSSSYPSPTIRPPPGLPPVGTWFPPKDPPALPPQSAPSGNSRRAVSLEGGASAGTSSHRKRPSVFNAQAVPFQPPSDRKWNSESEMNLQALLSSLNTKASKAPKAPQATQDPSTTTSASANLNTKMRALINLRTPHLFPQGTIFGHAPGLLLPLSLQQTLATAQGKMEPDNPGHPPITERRVTSSSSDPSAGPSVAPWIRAYQAAVSGTPSTPRSDTAGDPADSQHNVRRFDSSPDLTVLRASRASSAYNSSQSDANPGISHGLFDPYAASSSPLPSHAQPHPVQVNPYAQDGTSNGHNSYYPAAQFAQPLQYHLYAPFGPHKEDLPAYQRTAHDFFISDLLREELQRKSAATLQILPNSSLPPFIEPYHSFVPLDTSNQKNAALFGYPSWIYKAMSKRNGWTYALRRLEGFRLANDLAVRNTIQKWKRISNGNVVTVQEAFTCRDFGDSSLMIVTDYHPLAKTLAETHLTPSRFNARGQTSHVTEAILWSYIVQITNALRSIHATGLAARIIDPTKVILTSKNRIRLNACGVLDIVQYEQLRPMHELQKEDLLLFGKLILALGTNTASPLRNLSKSQEQFARSYSAPLKERTFWLLNQSPSTKPETIETFAASIEGYTINAFDAQEHLNDGLTQELSRELENSRIARLMIKLGFINERPDYSHDRQWAETGERYPIKLFRDYVFHQVDPQGNPVLDLAHVISCLNKLDAGSEEKITLTSRDDQIIIIVSFKEMKRAIDGAYGDLLRASRR